MKKVYAYTDSSKAPHSTTCGIAFVIVDNHNNIIYKKGKKVNLKSNNRGEMLAIIEAIKYVKDNIECDKLVIYSDNNWCVQCLNGRWNCKAHLDLIEDFKLLSELSNFKISVSWIKGHNGNKFNELADELANTIRISKNLEIY